MESAFLPSGMQIAWDATSLNKFKSCPRRYQLSILMGYRKKEKKIDIEWGKAFHSALETYHKQRFYLERDMQENLTETTFDPHTLALRASIREALERSGTRGDDGTFYPWPEEMQDSNKNRMTLLRSVIWFCDGIAKTDNLETHVLESGVPAVELSWRMSLPIKTQDSQYWYFLCGHIDRIARMGDILYPEDYKSTKGTVGTAYFERYDPDGQMYQYSIGGDVVLERPCFGVMVTAAQTAVNFTRFARAPIVVSQDQKEEWLHETYYWIKKAEECAVTYGLDGSIPWPKNDSSCFLCDFKRICNKSPGSRQPFINRDFYYSKWDPLKLR